jgi:hypothetical protein
MLNLDLKNLMYFVQAQAVSGADTTMESVRRAARWVTPTDQTPDRLDDGVTSEAHND